MAGNNLSLSNTGIVGYMVKKMIEQQEKQIPKTPSPAIFPFTHPAPYSSHITFIFTVYTFHSIISPKVRSFVYRTIFKAT